MTGLAEAAATDVLIWSASLTRWSDRAAQELADAGCEILGNVGTEVGLSLLVSSPGAVGREALARLFAAGGAVNARIEPIGSHAARYDAGA